MTEQPNQKLLDALAERRRQKALEAEKQTGAAHPSNYRVESETPEFDDLVPDEDSTYHRTDADIALDDAVQGIGIIEAYNRWIHKSTPDSGTRRSESIMISCPMPDHPDKNPSAWLNTDKNVWHCARCEKGGDQFDLAAIGLGYDYDHYKSDGTFAKLKNEMAESFGYTRMKVMGGTEWVAPEPPSPTPSPVTTPAPVVAETTEDDNISAPDAQVIELFPDRIKPYTSVGIEWRDIVPKQTFLRTYLEEVTQDDVPEEYHFWNGMIALSLAIGRDAILKDRPAVYGNLFICLLGKTGDGKSRSQRYMKDVVELALPHDKGNPGDKGVALIPEAASGEYLVSAFSQPVLDPTSGALLYHAPVKGYVQYGEMSSLMGRANRNGNTLKPLLQDLYDAGTIKIGSQTGGTKIAKDTYGCVTATSQSDALRGLMSNEDNASGFLNRWVFASARPKHRVFVNEFEPDYKPSVEALQRISGWCGFGKVLTYTPDAKALASEHFHNVIEPAKERNVILSRMDFLFKKLMLLFAANSMHDAVEVSDVEQAIALHEYLVDAFVHTEESVAATEMGDLETRILEMMHEYADKGTQITAKTIWNRVRRKYPKTEQIVRAFESLMKVGVVESYKSPEGQRGRPTTFYRLIGD